MVRLVRISSWSVRSDYTDRFTDLARLKSANPCERRRASAPPSGSQAGAGRPGTPVRAVAQGTLRARGRSIDGVEAMGSVLPAIL